MFIHLKAKPDYLNKHVCDALGEELSETAGLDGRRIAVEIFAHTLAYYGCNAAILVALLLSILSPGIIKAAFIALCFWVRARANPIDIGADSSLRIFLYHAIWKLF